MSVVITDTFIESFTTAPPEIQKIFGKQLANLLRDIRHPSLRAKKFDNVKWQARVNEGWRFYFTVNDKDYTLLDIIPHPK